MFFAQLVESLIEDADVRAALAEFVARKQAGDELAVPPPVEALTPFIEAKLPKLEALNEPDDIASEEEELERLLLPLRARRLRSESKAPVEILLHRGDARRLAQGFLPEGEAFRFVCSAQFQNAHVTLQGIHSTPQTAHQQESSPHHDNVEQYFHDAIDRK